MKIGNIYQIDGKPMQLVSETEDTFEFCDLGPMICTLFTVSAPKDSGFKYIEINHISTAFSPTPVGDFIGNVSLFNTPMGLYGNDEKFSWEAAATAQGQPEHKWLKEILKNKNVSPL